MFHGAAVEVSGESSPATVVEMEEFGGYGFGVAVGWLSEERIRLVVEYLKGTKRKLR